ncbi:MAG TPA: glycosyltransferase family 4 protein [Roseiflexaceae bacterium]|nr:glycosyltransferase family 4 protein [Roseiflexaceae bacterium]
MHIAFIDSWIQTVAEGSGTAAGIGGLRRALIARGHRVARLAPPTAWPANLTLRRLLFNYHLPALLRTLHYDLVVGFDIDGVRWSSARGGTPYVASIKGVIAEEMQHEGGRTRLLFELLSRLEGYNARHADAVLTTSDYCRMAILRHYGVPPSRVRLVPEGIDLAHWRELAAHLPQSSDGATILCVARQYPRKHVADLLRALPAVRRAVPRARAVIAGDGPEHARLRALASGLGLDDALVFTGALPDDKLALLYRQADIFCLPSVQEGFGIVFLEAMACGLPVVATLAAAIPEVVPDRRAGLLVPPGDVGALAHALIELLARPRQRAAYGAFGREYVERYDWDRVAQVFLEQVAPFVRAGTPADAVHE